MKRGEGQFAFVVQKHKATSLHYDFRLEIGGVMPSWSIPRGPTLDNKVKRLALPTTDHSMEYRHFEGVIPEGSYGAGPVMIWDEGTYNPEIEISKGVRKEITDKEEGKKVAAASFKDGNLKFQLYGKKLHGSFALVRTTGFAGRKDAWLLIKHLDKFCKEGYDAADYDFSTVSKMSIAEIVNIDPNTDVPSADDITKKTYNRVASLWASRPFDESKMKRERKDFEVLCKKGSLILDAGCGAGRYSLLLVKDGYEVVGIDYSDAMIREARKKVPNARFECMSMEKLGLDDNIFDGIWARASILHIKKKNIGQVLAGFNRVLKKGGALFISVKLGEGERMVKDNDGNERFFAYYTKSELLTVLRENGFSVLKSYTYKDTEKNIEWISTFSTK